MSSSLRYFPLKAAFFFLFFICLQQKNFAQTTLAPGDIAFVGYISSDDGVNGSTQDDEFAFILLKDISSGTIINFTDFGWLTTNAFQTANPCGVNTGAINDGIIRWTSSSALSCGTQIRIKCKYGLTANSGTVTGIQACFNNVSAYLSLAIGGDQIFAYQGLHSSPTLLAGISINKNWDASLASCYFSSNNSILPAALGALANTSAIPSAINAKYNCSITNELPTVLIPAINNSANWNTDNSFAPPVPAPFSLPLACSFSCAPGPNISVSTASGTIVACLGTASANPNLQQFTASGSLLTADILVTAPANFELSTSIGSGYSSSLTLTQSGGNVAVTTIYVRSSASAATGPISGNVVLTSTGTTTRNVAVTGTINPIPNAIATPSTQPVCSGTTITTIVLSGAVSGTSYAWTRDNTGTVTGIAASGSGNISGTLTNATTTPVTVTFTITPSANGCIGTPVNATVVVNPVPNAVATPSSQTICSGNTITTIVISGGVSGTTFNWTRDNAGTVTGIAASGSGDISGTLTNTTAAPVTVTFMITPSVNGCTGTPVSATILVNPTPNAVATPSSQSICSGNNITTIAITGNVAGTTYNWIRNNSGTVTGIAASGSGDISGALTNTTNAPVTVTFTITPSANGCSGASITATVTVNPLPDATITGGGLTTCEGISSTLSAVNNPTYTWGRSYSTAAPFNTIGTAQTQAITSSGFYKLTVTDANGCSASSTTIMNVADYVFNGSIGVGDPQQTGRINRFGVISTCASPKVCPGLFSASGARAYDVYTLTNPRSVSVCATIGLNSGCATNIFSVAYSSFDPNNPCNNYLADPGSSPTTSIFYEVTIPANSSVDIVVHEVNTGQGCSNYNLTVDMPRDPAAATPVPASINCGASSTITASKANSYLWSPGGQTTQSIVVSPLATSTYTVTLFYGNNGCSNTASATVTVVSTPPTITCPGNITLNNTFGQCSRIVNYTSTPGGTPAPTLSYTFSGATTGSGVGNGSGSSFNKGITTVTITATNACGSASCSFTVTIIDNEPPAISCPAAVTVSCASAVPVPNIGSVVASDNCPGVVVSFISDVISAQTCANRYLITRTYRATDAVGNFTNCTQTITVNDVTPPVVTCPAGLTVSCASAVPVPNISLVTATDNCAGAVTITFVGDVISGQTCANRYLITRTYRATDVCGNFADCTQTITVNDVTPPVITCPAGLTVSCASAVPPPNNSLVTATDNCAGVVTITFVSDVISGQTCPNRYTLTRSYRATDVCGNNSTCTQIITVNDQTAPVLTCPANINVLTPIGSCTAIVNFTPTATDNCNGAVTIVSLPASGSVFPIGTTTVNVTATDACGNSSTCSFTVTVLDAQLPVITQQPITKFVCDGTNTSFTVVSTNALNYQWQQWNGTAWVNIAGATSATLTINAVNFTLNTNSYRVAVIGLCTTIQSAPASLYVNPLPLINLSTSIPPFLTPGQNMNILSSVSPSGGSYRWFLNGSQISGAQGASLNGITVDGLGTYRLIYTDPNGCTNNSIDIIVVGQQSNDLWIYPNPNQGSFNIRFFNKTGEKVVVNVIDSKGARVFSKEFVTTNSYTNMPVDLSALGAADGSYIVTVVGQDGSIIGSRKILVYRR